MSSSSNQNVGRDELAAMLGASYASDLIVAAGTSASDLAKKSGVGGGVGGAVVVGRPRKHYIKGGAGGIDEEDVSKMDRAQAAALVARKFAAGGSGSAAANANGGAGSGAMAAAGATAMRHRASGKRKRMLQHHLLVEDYLTDTQDGTIMENRGADDNDGMKSQYYVKEEDDQGLKKEMDDDDDEEERFAIRPADGMRKKSEAKVLVRRGAGDESKNRRHRSSSSSSLESGSSSSSESVSSSVSSSSSSLKQRSHSTRHGRRRRRKRGERGHGKHNDGGRTRSNSSSSSSSDDQADIRRRKAREKCAQRNQDEGGSSTAISSIHQDTNRKQQAIVTEAEQNQITRERNKDDAMSAESKNDKSSVQIDEREQTMDDRSSTNRNNGRNRSPRSKRRLSPSSVKSTTDSSSEESSSSSSSSSSSDDESIHNATLPLPISKPIFVPKSKRGTVAELEARNQKHEEFEKRRAQEAEKRAIQSRALVAAAAAMSTVGKANYGIGEGDEFDTGEVGGEFIPVPDDTDPTEEDSPELVAAERNAWEVRELIRILRDVDDALERERERRELERRRGLTDEERLEEDRLSGRYRAPGEARRVNGGVGSKGGGKQHQDESSNRYLQRFHHRGAFYMDEDTLNQAGEDDVRHRAADYSRAATGEDKIDKSTLPKVMQVKKFGFAGYSTKYKGLSKEDTTDKKMDFLPIRGHAAAGRSSRHGHAG